MANVEKTETGHIRIEADEELTPQEALELVDEVLATVRGDLE